MKVRLKGGDVECPKGEGGKCRPMGGVRSGTYRSEEYRPGKGIKMSKKEEAQAEKEWRVSRALLKAKKTEPQSTAPGVRGKKKGSQYFFGRSSGETDV
jgi:hypothetical protein